MNVYRNLDLGTTGQVVKVGQTSVYGWFLYNNAASTRYIKLYNKATAATGSDTPVATMGLPAGSAANIPATAHAALDGFPLGLSVRATTGVADADTGAPTANDVVVNIFYA